jgi:2'-5' RNA ligase
VGGDERLRLFLALRLPGEALDEIERWQAAQLSGVRRVARDQLHITLAFLGSRPAGEVDGIVVALRDAASGAGKIQLTPVRYRETRSVGMLVLDDANGNAAGFAGDLQERLERLGVYRRESRPWLPHLTVARWRERPRLHPAPPPDRTFVPSDAAAYLSRLRPGGAEYRVLDSVALEVNRGGK